MSKILVTTGYYFHDHPGGSGRLALDLATEMVRRGHETWYLCQDVAGINKEIEVREGLKILRYSLDTRRGLHPLRHREHIRKAGNLVDKYIRSVDIVHGHMPVQFVSATRMLSDTAINWCYSIHSPAVLEMDIVWKDQGLIGGLKRYMGLPVVRRIEKDCLSNAEHLQCESLYTKKEMLKAYGEDIAGGIEVIPGWADQGVFYPRGEKDDIRKKLGWQDSETIFFCLRRLAPRMGLDNLIRACGRLKREKHDFKLKIGGEGPLREELMQLVETEGLEDRIAFLGRVDEEDLPMMYCACDASVIPTRDLECFGLIALESLACGTITLATPAGALPEILRNFSNTWLSRGNDEESIADLLRRYIQGRVDIIHKEEIVTKISELYSKEKGIERYLRMYGITE